MNNLLATMCYIDNGDSYLMLKRNKKENDIHEGLTISVGGKFEIGESPEDCVIREVKEETNLDIIKPKLRGIITFPNFDGNKDWYTYVFTAKEYTGNLTKDCNEGDLVLSLIHISSLIPLPIANDALSPAGFFAKLSNAVASFDIIILCIRPFLDV